MREKTSRCFQLTVALLISLAIASLAYLKPEMVKTLVDSAKLMVKRA